MSKIKTGQPVFLLTRGKKPPRIFTNLSKMCRILVAEGEVVDFPSYSQLNKRISLERQSKTEFEFPISVYKLSIIITE
jgi:hypothetical protein